MPVEKGSAGSARHPRSTAFLLAQVGAHAASRFGSMLADLKLAPPHAGILRAIAGSPGISQQALATLLGMVPSRLVALLDELEALGLLERRDNVDDRRVYALHLTGKGGQTMAELGRIARAHDDAVCAALTAKEREQLSEFLKRIAEDQKLTPGVHPGYASVGAGSPRQASRPRSRERGESGPPR